MLNALEISALTEDEINEYAHKYWKAKKSDDKSEIDYYKIILYSICISSSILNKKLKSKLAGFEIYDNDADDEIADYFDYQLKYFNYEKNDNFVAYMMTWLSKYESKKIKKEKERNEKQDENQGVDNPFINEMKRAEIRSRLPMLILNFYKHNSAKKATKARYEYFRVFNTENIIDFIKDSSNTRYFNESEAYESTDKDFVRFIAFTPYKKLGDIIAAEFKMFSDVLEHYDFKDKQIYIPCDSKIISEYFYKSLKYENRPSDANISQFRKKYKEYFREIWTEYEKSVD